MTTPSSDHPVDAPHRSALGALAADLRRNECAAGEEASSLPPAFRTVVTLVVGPLLTCFVDWVLRDARARGLDRLCFVSRDGQVLLRIAELFAQRSGGPVCSYLYGSRQAWLLPTLATNPELPPSWLLLAGQSTAPRHVLRRLAIDCAEVREQLTSHGLLERDWDQQVALRDSQVYQRVLADPQVAELVQARAELARQATLGYLAQEGLAGSTTWALVDVGWTLKTQKALRDLLRASGASGPELGYYLAVLAERVDGASAGNWQAFVDERSETGLRPFFRNTQLIEQLFTMASHGSVRGYELQGHRFIPVLDAGASSPERQRFAEALQREILRFAVAYLDAGLDRADLGPLRTEALAATSRFLAIPPAAAVRAVAGLEIGDDQNEARRLPVAVPLTVKHLAAMALRRLRLIDASRYRRGFAWLEGSLALSRWPIRALAPLVSASEAVTRRPRSRSKAKPVG